MRALRDIQTSYGDVMTLCERNGISHELLEKTSRGPECALLDTKRIKRVSYISN